MRWDQIDSNMVYLDGTPLEQFFHAGDYIYPDPVTQKVLTFHCEEGAKVPEISREIPICADAGGIYIDGNRHKWEDLVDEDGFPYTEVGAHGGDWTLEYGSAKLTFTIGMDAQNTSDMVKVINSMKTGPIIYKWTCDYAGAGEEKAVDATVGKENALITDALASRYATEADLLSALTYTVRVGKFQTGERGIWLEDSNNVTIADSFRSWGSMGIDPWKQGDPNQPKDPTAPVNPDWDTGTGISKEIVYTYKDNNIDPDDATGVSFTFQLSDVTSEDSVIDGLDGMTITPGAIRTNYSLPATYEKPANDKSVLHLSSSSSTSVTFDQEKLLSRDFDTQAYDIEILPSVLQYTPSISPTVTWKDTTTTGAVVNMSGDTIDTEQQIKADVLAYLQKVEQKISGQRIDDLCNGITSSRPKTLDEVVGASNITTAGYFNAQLTLDWLTMKVTSNGLKDGNTYHNAFIDFRAVSDIRDLIGTGFDTTCATCNNHYSIRFVESLDGSTDVSSTLDGYKYKQTSSGSNYTLEIDISSLQANGVSAGSHLPEALVKITDNGFDFHYTQYASEGSKLYVLDNRSLGEIDETRATFYTVPWDSECMKTYRFELSSTDNKNRLNLAYDYYFSDVTDYIQAVEEKSDGGAFVKLAGTNPPQYLRLDDPNVNGKDVVAKDGSTITNFDSSNPPSDLQRHHIRAVYKNGSTVYNTLDEVAEAYAKAAVEKMLTNTKTTLHANDYSKFSINGDENDNKAVTTLFDSQLHVDDSDATMLIQCSGREDDDVIIPRYAINAGILRMSKASGMSQEQAEMTLRNVDRGLKWLSGVRTTYGGYQNRLEHTYANNTNTSENTQAAESRIRDTDMAEAMVEQSKQNILLQANQSMLAQNMKSSDWIVQLLGQ